MRNIAMIPSVSNHYLYKYAGNTALYIDVFVTFNSRFILYFDIKIFIFLALLALGYHSARGEF